MAPGPGRNVQLPASVLQPTTSIYCTVLQRCAPLSQRIQMGSEALREAQKNNTTPKRFRSPPRHSANATGRKERKPRRNYNMGGTGGMVVVVVVVHQLFPSSVNVSPPGKIYSPTDATNRCGSGDGEGGGEGGYNVNTRQK